MASMPARSGNCWMNSGNPENHSTILQLFGGLAETGKTFPRLKAFCLLKKPRLKNVTPCRGEPCCFYIMLLWLLSTLVTLTSTGDTISGNFSMTTLPGSRPKLLSSERLIFFRKKWNRITSFSTNDNSLSWLRYFSITINWKSLIN